MNEPFQAKEDAPFCLVCGLCCDGTLFSPTIPDEISSREPAYSCRKNTGSDQPCPEHSGQGCRIYADRPEVCREFRCVLLISCDEKKISFAEARRKIFQARSLVDEMQQTLRRIEPDLAEASLAEVWNQWTEKAKSGEGADFRKRYGQALLQLAGLRFFLEMHFLEKTTKPSL